MSYDEPTIGASYVYVGSQAELAPLVRAVESEPWHALDTESNSGFAYRERLCLLQLNVGGSLWLVDLVALEGTEALEPLRPVLESPHLTTYLHGGEFDVGCLKRDYRIGLRGVWDSQQAASFLGLSRTGYAAVVEEICGVELEKAFAQHDWARRPLDEQVLAYAIDDIRYLPEVCRALEERVAEAEIEEEVAIANRVVEGATWEGSFRADGFWKIKGAGNLKPTALPVLAALWKWRDDVARVEDRAPGRTLNSRLLLALAANPPRSRNALRRLGVRGRLAARSGELLELIARVRENPPEVPPRPRAWPPRGDVDGRTARRRGERLKKWRDAEATRRGVSHQVVLPSRALDHLKRNGAAELEQVPQLGPKRVRMYGEKLRELVD